MKMFDPLRLSEMMDDGELWSLPQRVTDDEEADIRETLENFGKLLLSRKDVIHNNGAAITEQLRGLEACLKKATTDSWNPVALFWKFFKGAFFLRALDSVMLIFMTFLNEHGPFLLFVWSFFRGRVFGLCLTCLGLRGVDLHDFYERAWPFLLFVWSFFGGRVFGLCLTCLGLRGVDLHDFYERAWPFLLFVWSFFGGAGVWSTFYVPWTPWCWSSWLLWTSMALFCCLCDPFSSLFMIDTRTRADT